MQILVHTDNHTRSSERFHDRVKTIIEGQIGHRAGQISRIEVFLSDENAGKSGNADKRCLIEARVDNIKPVVVRHHADNFVMAVEMAAEKLDRSLESLIGRLNDQKLRPAPIANVENLSL